MQQGKERAASHEQTRRDPAARDRVTEASLTSLRAVRLRPCDALEKAKSQRQHEDQGSHPGRRLRRLACRPRHQKVPFPLASMFHALSLLLRISKKHILE